MTGDGHGKKARAVSIDEPPISRENFDLDPGRLWVMHCSEGPVPRAAAEAAAKFLAKETRPWLIQWEEDFQGLPRRTRIEAARLFGAQPQDISLVQTTSAGLGMIARTYPWRTGDEVVIPLGEFPTNIWPWKTLASRGVQLREVPLWDGHEAGAAAWETTAPTGAIDPEERLLEALGKRSRLLAVSHVRFQDGVRLDLGRLAEGCRSRGVDLVVDGCQAAGTLPIRCDGVAAYCSGGHKGMLSPQGLAVLVTSEDFRRKTSAGGSWLSVEGAVDFERPSTDHHRAWAPDGTRFEQGVPNLLGCAAMEVSLRMINEAGLATIAAWIDDLGDRLISGLSLSPRWCDEAERLASLRAAGRTASIFSLRGDSRELAGVMEAGECRGIGSSIREGYLRIAFHGWHTPAEVDDVVDWLRSAWREDC